MIVAATLIVWFVVLYRANPFVGLVGIWALYGIILKHRELNVAESLQITTTAWICLVALVVVFVFFRYGKGVRPALRLRPAELTYTALVFPELMFQIWL